MKKFILAMVLCVSAIESYFYNKNVLAHSYQAPCTISGTYNSSEWSSTTKHLYVYFNMSCSFGWENHCQWHALIAIALPNDDLIDEYCIPYDTLSCYTNSTIYMVDVDLSAY